MVEREPGRREQNKQRTRDALERAAARLFEEHGFAATTVRDIAAAAGVGERTFFRYFPSKEDLVLQQARDVIGDVMQRVRERPAEEALLAALRSAILDWLDETGSPPTILVAGPPKSSEHDQNEAHALVSDLEDSLTRAFSDRLEAAGEDLTDRLVVLRAAIQARAGVAAVRGMVLFLTGEKPCEAQAPATPPGPGASNEEVKQLVREAFAALDVAG